jgi:hypothetical protein
MDAWSFRHYKNLQNSTHNFRDKMGDFELVTVPLRKDPVSGLVGGF